jgi:FMN phosphatase YigB (HAD superfamily)
MTLPENESIRLLTYDVFDTLLSRVVVPSHSVWYEVGRKARNEGLIQIDPSNFKNLRAKAAAQMRKRELHSTIEGIYSFIARELELPAVVQERLINIELETEAENIVVIPAGKSLLDESRGAVKNGRVVFVSDMHLPSIFIREQLAAHGCWRDGDHMWVSCEAGASKKQGTLYKLVSQYENVAASLCLHTGDNMARDVLAARACGFQVRHFPMGLPNRYERRLSDFADSQDSVCGLMAGVSRSSRLTITNESSSLGDDPITNIGTGVVGPFLASYCLWVLSRARRYDLKRLYFISRDGEILRQICAVLAPQLGLNIELRYLYGGRLAWQRPSLALDPDESALRSFVKRTLYSYTLVRPSGIAARLGLELSIMSEVLPYRVVEGSLDDRPLTSEERGVLFNALISESGIELLREAAEASLPTVLGYLRQEGLFEDDRWALVDVGWKGTTVRFLNRLLRLEGSDEARVFFSGYFGQTGEERLPRCEAFVWDTEHYPERHRPAGALSIIEAVCSGSHGPVRGYVDLQDCGINPDFITEKGIAFSDWSLDELRNATLDFTNLLARHLRPGHLERSDPEAALAVLTLLCEQPTTVEASFLGSCPREEDAEGISVFPLARPFRLIDLPGLMKSGNSIGRNLGWRHGALKITPWVIREIVRSVLIARDALRR